MKTNFSRGAAAALVSLILTVRMFVGLEIEFPNAANAIWLCPALGLAIFLPFLFALRQVELKGGNGGFKHVFMCIPHPLKIAIFLLFSLILLWDAACMVRLMASSYNVLALNNVTVHLLIFPLGIVVFASSLFGLNAAGNSARVALRLLSIILLVLALVQLKQLRLGYLVPLMGSGTVNLISGGLYCAGNMAIVSIVWMQSQKNARNRGISVYFAASALVTSLLLLLESAGHPAMLLSEFTRAARIEFVLSNGRMSLAPQFLLNILWYAGLLYLIAAETASAVSWIRSIDERLPAWTSALLAALFVSAAAIWNPHWLREASWFSFMVYPILGGVLVMLMLFSLLKERRQMNG